MHELEFRAMNTEIVLVAEGEPERAAEGLQRARALIEGYEARFTRFSGASELSHLNRAAGTWFHASPELFEIVQLARALFTETGGLFNPSILDALESAGYDKSLDEVQARGAGAPRPGANRPAADLRGVRLDPPRRGILLPAGMRIDLGGIAKGWIAERAANDLARSCDACAVNAGGDLFAVGRPAGQDAWRVALEDPREPDRTLAILRIGPGAVATSSVARRRWRQGDRIHHHLIDPRHGLPAGTDLLSVTVIAPHAATAEAFAKALLIAGSREAGPLAAHRRDVVFIAVDVEGHLWGSQNAMKFLEAEVELT